MSNVVKFSIPDTMCSDLHEKIWAVINDAPDDMSVMAVLGILDLVKEDILQSLRDQ